MLGSNNNYDPLKIKNNQLLNVLECSLCFTKYDFQFHLPLVLTCGHNICSMSVEQLFKQKQISCPFCKQISHYKNKESIPRNFALIEIIQQLDHPSFQISFEEDLKLLNPVKKLVDTIKQENKHIETLKENITKKLNKIQEYNQDLVRYLEVFIAKNMVERKQILRKYFLNVNNFKDLDVCQNKCRAVFQNMKHEAKKVIKNSYTITRKQAIQEVIMDICTANDYQPQQDKSLLKFTFIKKPPIDFAKLIDSNIVFKDEILCDYMELIKNVKTNFVKLINAPRNFVIKKEKNFHEIIL